MKASKFKRILSALMAALIVFTMVPYVSPEVSAVDDWGSSGECEWYRNGTTLVISGYGFMEDYSPGRAGPWGTGITEVIIEDGVTNIGASAFYGCTNLERIVIPDSVTDIGEYAFFYCERIESIDIPDAVTSIAELAFCNCRALLSVVIPEGVTVLETGVFSSCVNLTEVTLHDKITTIGMSAFAGCKMLTDIEIPDSVTSIGSEGFSNCTSLTSVEIPEGITTIESNAFYSCISLESVVIPSSVTKMDYCAFNGCSSLKAVYITDLESWLGITFVDGISGSTNPITFVDYLYIDGEPLTDLVIPEGTESINARAFIGYNGLKSVKIPSSVTSIGNSAFWYCEGLEEVDMSECTGSISFGDSAFDYCTNLKEVFITDMSAWCTSSFQTPSSNPLFNGGGLYLDGELVTELIVPDGTESIGSNAFNSYSKLIGIDIPASVKSIGSYAFGNCSNLERITVDENNGVYHAGGNCLIETESKTLLLGTNKSVIPDDGSVTSIGVRAFYMCTELENIDIPDGVTSIGDVAFYECTGLRKIDIPDGVTSIGIMAFFFCKNAEYLVIPDSVINVGMYAFGGLSRLESIWYTGTKEEWDLNINYTFDSNYIKHFGAEVISLSFDECTKASEKIYKCVDGHTLEFVRPATGKHSPGAEATCTEAQTCVGCGKILKEALGHTPGPDATCTTDKICTVCGELFVKGEHKPGDEATCTTDQICTVCKTVLVEAFEHSYTDNHDATCNNNCGYVRTVGPLSGIIGDCTWTLEDTVLTISGSGTIWGYNSKEPFPGKNDITKLVIKDGITGIGFDAFKGCTSLECVDLSECKSLTKIDYGAFGGCEKLDSVFIADLASLFNIFFVDFNSNPLRNGADLYIDGKLITNLVIPDEITSISRYAFAGCTSLESVDMTSCTSISEYAFHTCTNLKSIKLSDGITKIGYMTFFNCSSLETVKLPLNLQSIGDYAFYECSALTTVYYRKTEGYWKRISIGSENYCLLGANIIFGGECNTSGTVGNSKWHIENTVLAISGNGDMLDYRNAFQRPAEWDDITKIIIEKDITAIGNDSFSYCKNLTTVEIHSNISRIGRDAFSKSTSLTSVNIPESVSSIEKNAFSNCTSLTTVYYGGTEEQWNKITVADGNDYLLNANIIFTRKTVSENSNIGASYYDGTLPENAVLNTVLKEGEDGGNFKIEVEIPGMDTANAVTYDINFTVDGVETQPNGKVKVSIPIPEGFDPEKSRVYHIDDEGNVVDMEAWIEDDKIVFETDHFSLYSVIEELDEPEVPDYILGDMDMNGSITPADLNIMKRIIGGVVSPSEYQFAAADINGDGKITALDSNFLTRIVAGSIDVVKDINE